MTVKIKKGFRKLVEEAEAEIETLSAEEAIRLHGEEGVQLVDLRDVRELQREGRIPGSFHMPRCMLEFWIDPDSPYFKEIFNENKRFVFYCNKGWRSALATSTAQQMGLEQVAHIGGGYSAWTEAGGPTEEFKK
ncbi:MAG: rhodanese-like domain-containing protein [Gammaproteobacteria bacterium]|nr:rhodanese-like domain-containing protein [Gammaproteobacteria bacterium]